MSATPAEVMINVAQALSTHTGIDYITCVTAVQDVCVFYNRPMEETANDLYLYLMDGQEQRAMVHQFRESVRQQVEMQRP